MKITHDTFFYTVCFVATLGVIASTYYYVDSSKKADQINSLQQQKLNLESYSEQKEAELAIANTSIDELKSEIKDIQDDLEDLADDYHDEKNRNEDFEDQIRSLSGTLGDLDKLSKLDEELLQKYSKVYFLNENYIPEKLEQIDDKYILEGKDLQFFHARAVDHLEDMFKAAAKDDIDLKIVSAYRSFDHQHELKGQFTQVYGEGANTFSADQGYSEHQLGTTVDITTPSIGGAYASFAETEAYEWLLDNAHKYGFILSYPEDNNFYIFEPWHWRFVGTDLAKYLDRKNTSFYDIDQRDIDEYLLEIFD